MNPMFDPTGVQTHDLQIMTVNSMSLRRQQLAISDCRLGSISSIEFGSKGFYSLFGSILSWSFLLSPPSWSHLSQAHLSSPTCSSQPPNLLSFYLLSVRFLHPPLFCFYSVQSMHISVAQTSYWYRHLIFWQYLSSCLYVRLGISHKASGHSCTVYGWFWFCSSDMSKCWISHYIVILLLLLLSLSFYCTAACGLIAQGRFESRN